MDFCWLKAFVVTVFRVLTEPVVEGVAVTGFLFFSDLPNTMLSTVWNSTQEIRSRDLEIKHKRAQLWFKFTLIWFEISSQTTISILKSYSRTVRLTSIVVFTLNVYHLATSRKDNHMQKMTVPSVIFFFRPQSFKHSLLEVLGGLFPDNNMYSMEG